MKKILLSVAIAFGAFSATYAQEPYPCHTDEKTKEFVDALSPEERAQYLAEKEANELLYKNTSPTIQFQLQTQLKNRMSFSILSQSFFTLFTKVGLKTFLMSRC